MDNINKIVEQFGFRVLNAYRGRGAYICETNQGVKLLKEMETSVNRTWFEYYVKKHLIEQGFTTVDQFELIDKKPYMEYEDKKYILKNWCNGRECNLFDEKETLNGVRNLAKLHKALQQVQFPEHILLYSDLGELPRDLKRHAMEFKRVRKYIRKQSHWTEFDILFLKNFSYYYDKAKKSIKSFEEEEYGNLVGEAKQANTVCHGQYSQHNILLTQSYMLTVNFEKSSIDLQINDFYQLLRKVMEKNDWSITFGMKMIEAYDGQKTLNKKHLNFLYYNLLYPEKFWKICNYYFNTKKVWLPKKNIEKLEKIIAQKDKKAMFLEKFSQYIS